MVSYSFGPFTLDPASRTLLQNGQRIEVTAKVFETLVFLVQNRGRVVSKDEFFKAIWDDVAVEESNLVQNISVLRRALGDNRKDRRFVATIPGRGYSFVATVAEQSGLPVQLSISPVTGPDHPNARLRGIRPYTRWLFAIVGASVVALASLLLLHRDLPQAVFFTASPLTAYTGLELCPSLAPDGERVAFIWDGPKQDNFDIYVKDIGGGQLLRLTNEAAPDISPAWSPDGNTIAYLHFVGDSEAELLLIPAIGPYKRQNLGRVTCFLSDTYFRLRYLGWSADSKSLVLADAPHSGELRSLYLVSKDSGERHRLTFPPLDSDDFDPAFSPDMKYLAFVRYSTWGAVASDLYLLRLSKDLKAEGLPRRLTSFNRRIGSPVWSPDGRRILFTRQEPAGLHSFWSITVSGSSRIEPIPIPAEDAFSVTLSSSGRRLVYSRNTSNINLWKIRLAEDTNQKVLGIFPWITSTSDEDNPSFSPDGKQVAFQSLRSGTGEIWLCDRNGSNQRQVTNMGGVVSGFPRWSPDGREIVFHSRISTSANLYLISAAGGRPRRLTTGAASMPSWSHDGKWIYFASGRTGLQHIWKMSPEGGPAYQVSQTAGFCPLESKDGKALYYVTLPNCDLYKRPLGVGPEEKLFSGVAGHGSSYAPAKNGIYFVRTIGQSKAEELAFFSYATRQARSIATLPAKTALGLALSPDERTLLYGQIDQDGSDLMLVDHFH